MKYVIGVAVAVATVVGGLAVLDRLMAKSDREVIQRLRTGLPKPGSSWTKAYEDRQQRRQQIIARVTDDAQA